MSKKNKLIEDFNELLEKTVDFMRERKVTTLDLKEPSSQPESCWGIIAKKLKKRFYPYVSLQIYIMWKRNTKNYRENVEKILQVISPKENCRRREVDNMKKKTS
jgi:hypothetical protein